MDHFSDQRHQSETSLNQIVNKSRKFNKYGSQKIESDSESESKRVKPTKPQEKVVDIDLSDDNREFNEQTRVKRKNNTMEYPLSDKRVPDALAEQYFAQSNGYPKKQIQPKSTRHKPTRKDYRAKPQKHVSISMSDTPNKFMNRQRTGMAARVEHNFSPGVNSALRMSHKASPQTMVSNRSSISTKPYSFRVGNPNKQSRFAMSTPRKNGLRGKTRGYEVINTGPSAEILAQQLEHEK